MRHAISLIATICSIMFISSAPASAWSHDPHVNDPVRVIAGHSVTDIKAITDGQGGTFIVWMEPTSMMALQHVDAGGNLWPAPVFVPTPTGNGFHPVYDIIADDAGGIFVAFSSWSGNQHLAFAQHVDADGVSLWGTGAALVPSVTTSSQYTPRLALDGSGGVFVVWEDTRNQVATAYDIWGQHVNVSGVTQ